MTNLFSPPDQYYLTHPNKTRLPLAAHADDLVVPNADQSTQPVLVPHGARVFILEDAITALRVLIAHGAHTGANGWVPAAWVRVPQRYEHQTSAA